MKSRTYKIYLDNEGRSFTTVTLSEDDIWEFVAQATANGLLPGRNFHGIELENEWEIV